MPTTEEWRKELARALEGWQQRDSTELIGDLHRLAATMGPDEGEALLDASPDFLDDRPALFKARCAMVVRNEILQTQQLLESGLDGPARFAEIANSFSTQIYRRSADMFRYLDFRGCRRMVLVGCGWMPVTLFYVHDRTDVAQLIGLDVVPEAIEIANALSAKLRYGRLKAILEDGRSYDYSRADIVYVVGMVNDKPAVLSRIADTAPDNVQVVVNDAYSLGRLWHEPVEPLLDPRLEVAARGPGRPTGRDLFVRRRPAPTGDNARPSP